MKHFTLLISLFLALNVAAQNEPEVSLVFLENDDIASVNVDQDDFIASVGGITDLFQSEFFGVADSQKIALLFTVHKAGMSSYELFSNPELDSEKRKDVLQKLSGIEFSNTRFLDFPLLFLINGNYEDVATNFPDFVHPSQKFILSYVDADLLGKHQAAINYANEILPVFGAYEIMVDEKFEGVKNFGRVVTDNDFSTHQDVMKMTGNNPDYWRAVMEMEVGNQLIPTSKIFMLVSQGEFDQAAKYIEVFRAFSKHNTISYKYLRELADLLSLFIQSENSIIENGIAEHDQGNYEEAIKIYQQLLSIYPNSAWARYELYYSQNALEVKNGTRDVSDRSDWDLAKIEIFDMSPLYNMDVRANSGKEAYLLFRRQSISELFQDQESVMKDFYSYGDIAFDLGVFDFAAELFWLSFTYDKESENSLNMYLYCLEKLGVTNLKNVFKGNFEKEFKKIDKEKEKEMKQSSIYKAFK